MAELVSCYALQFIAIEFGDGATGETKNRVLRIFSRRKCVDRILLQNINWWNRHAAGDRHFINNIA